MSALYGSSHHSAIHHVIDETFLSSLKNTDKRALEMRPAPRKHRCHRTEKLTMGPLYYAGFLFGNM